MTLARKLPTVEEARGELEPLVAAGRLDPEKLELLLEWFGWWRGDRATAEAERRQATILRRLPDGARRLREDLEALAEAGGYRAGACQRAREALADLEHFLAERRWRGSGRPLDVDARHFAQGVVGVLWPSSLMEPGAEPQAALLGEVLAATLGKGEPPRHLVRWVLQQRAL